jgi:hypothetical protein
VFSWNCDASTFVWYMLADDYHEGIYIVTTDKQVRSPTFPNGLAPGSPPGRRLTLTRTCAQARGKEEP